MILANKKRTNCLYFFISLKVLKIVLNDFEIIFFDLFLETFEPLTKIKVGIEKTANQIAIKTFIILIYKHTLHLTNK